MEGLGKGACKKRPGGPRPLSLEERTQGDAPCLFPPHKEMKYGREGLVVLCIQKRCKELNRLKTR